MTKYLIIIGLVLVGCGKGGGTVNDPVTGNPPTLAPQCKAFKSAWQSTSDSEAHDFTSIPFSSVGWTNYSFIGYNGVACPGVGQPLGIQLYDGNSVVINSGFHYVIELQNNAPAIGCHHYQDGSGPSQTHASAVIKVECDQITICKNILMNPGECKEFR